jgi:DNA-directed RNA polymerase beta' subunit
VHSEICSVQKGGGVPLSIETIVKCTKIASVKAKEITQLLQQELKNDEKNKKNEKLPEYAKSLEHVSMKEKEEEENDDVLSDVSVDEKEVFEKKTLKKINFDDVDEDEDEEIVNDDDDEDEEDVEKIFEKDLKDFKKKK